VANGATLPIQAVGVALGALVNSPTHHVTSLLVSVTGDGGLLKVPVLLLIGDKDTTAIGKDVAPAEVREKLGHYPELGKTTAAAIKDARLVEFPNLGHAPQIQDPDAFHKALLEGIGRRGGE